MQRQDSGDGELGRFLEAQRDVYDTALSELRAGRKRSHWMWFVFPQLRGLGRSAMSHHYGIAGRAEAEAYLRHPELGSRLVECTGAVLALPPSMGLHDVFGSPDDMKFISSMTLFRSVTGAADVFDRALARFNGGKPDPVTERLLAR